MAGATHLVTRFFGSLRPGGPSAVDEAWVEGLLSPGELDLWRQFYGPDRRHSTEVARRVDHTMENDADRRLLAAALLHDIGKTASRLRTYTRVVATLSAAVAGREAADLWVKAGGITRRIGLYIKHPEIGADLLAMAGSDPLVVKWAREHHLTSEQWTIDAEWAAVLHEADDD